MLLLSNVLSLNYILLVHRTQIDSNMSDDFTEELVSE